MENKYLQGILKQRNPFLLFSPFLIFFSLYVIYAHKDSMDADEGRYVQFAMNLIGGFYSPPAPDIDLWCGPGYPIVLIPFRALGLPLITFTLLNVIFHYLSIVFLFKSLIRFVSFPFAIACSLFWAFSYPAFSYIALIHTETITWFLITLLMYCVINCFAKKNIKFIFFSGIILGYIALTKIIFGYVILVFLVALVPLIIFTKNKNHKTSLFIILIAFATSAPYLIYTYNLTGRIFYWGNAGGMSLYWMSTPFEMEYGDWNNETFDAMIDAHLTGGPMLLKDKHLDDFNKIMQKKGIERDDAYKAIAIDNIKSHPVKYFKNIIANLSRALFGFPYSYSYQRPLMKAWYSSIIFTLSLLSMILTLVNWQNINYSVRFLLILGVTYLGGSLLLSMENRMFLVVVPLILFWTGYILQKTIKINLVFNDTN
jgi:hypothetical protein